MKSREVTGCVCGFIFVLPLRKLSLHKWILILGILPLPLLPKARRTRKKRKTMKMETAKRNLYVFIKYFTDCELTNNALLFNVTWELELLLFLVQVAEVVRTLPLRSLPNKPVRLFHLQPVISQPSVCFRTTLKSARLMSIVLTLRGL